ncbi:MAG: FtsX-like permease family protein [Thermodesulforhabdaceae bacterium]
MKIPWGVIFQRVYQDIVGEPLIFITAILCITLACLAGPLALGSKGIEACLMPPWANRAVVMVSWKMKTSVQDRQKVLETIRSSAWCESVREVSGKEIAKEVEGLAKSFGQGFSLGDLSEVTGYVEIILSGKCLDHPQKCQAFVDSLGADPAVDSVYSGIALAVEARNWFSFVRHSMITLTAFLLLLMLVMLFLLYRLSFYRRMKEIYLWDLLGASPSFKRLACYMQALPMIAIAWTLSLFLLYRLKKYWQHLEHFFGTEQNCLPSYGTLFGFSIITLVLVIFIVFVTVEWVLKRNWVVSSRTDWIWSD